MPEISIGRLRGGFCVYWQGDDGKRRRYQLAARTRKEAEAEALKVYAKETYDSRDTDPTIAEIWAVYIEHLGDKPTAKTMGFTGKAVLPHFGHYRSQDIDKDLCDSYSELRYSQGRKQGTVWTELGHVKSALKYAAKVRMIDRAPHIWRPSKPAPKDRFLTRAEISILVDACASPHIRLAVILLLGTAGRVGAILDLEWDRVDFQAGQINLRLPDGEGRKGRANVPMNGMTRAALSATHEAALSDYVVEYAGGPIKSIKKGFTSACERAKLEGVSLHTLRHTAAVHMAEAGVPMEKISQYLGHSHTSVTERIYARYTPSAMQDAADVLNFIEMRKA